MLLSSDVIQAGTCSNHSAGIVSPLGGIDIAVGTAVVPVNVVLGVAQVGVFPGIEPFCQSQRPLFFRCGAYVAVAQQEPLGVTVGAGGFIGIPVAGLVDVALAPPQASAEHVVFAVKQEIDYAGSTFQINIIGSLFVSLHQVDADDGVIVIETAATTVGTIGRGTVAADVSYGAGTPVSLIAVDFCLVTDIVAQFVEQCHAGHQAVVGPEIRGGEIAGSLGVILVEEARSGAGGDAVEAFYRQPGLISTLVPDNSLLLFVTVVGVVAGSILFLGRVAAGCRSAGTQRHYQKYY